MKAIYSRLAAIVAYWLALVGQSCGPDDGRKLRHDSTYSTHNYKHPNKADTARKQEAKPGVAVRSPGAGESNLTNYKRQAPNQAPVGGITVDYTTSPDVAGQNYKMQRPGQSTGVSGSGVAGTDKRNRSKNGAGIGD